ncbi:hypothetical protein VFPBJ_05224 [Purpureocillium lilacinum]|uniref:Uncharacterized protein n=1 Tax=Purpureocillium lilacinum TaxID=33203 RepID=A0A179GR73_PURLI|nr:hypothetical protein VFPBJ_05224 [Purpureocillium lilacinum]
MQAGAGRRWPGHGSRGWPPGDELSTSYRVSCVIRFPARCGVCSSLPRARTSMLDTKYSTAANAAMLSSLI